MSFQFETDFFDDELGADDATTVADWATGGIASAGKGFTDLVSPDRTGQTMDPKTQAERAAAYAAMAKVGQAVQRSDGTYAPAGSSPKTIQDVIDTGTRLASLGGSTPTAGTSADAAVRDMLVNAARAMSSLPSPSAPRIVTPGTTGAVETKLDLSPIVQALDPRLRGILGGINAMRLQAQATSEHNTLMKEAQFRKEAIRRLSVIESKLPRSSRLSQQIRTVKVLLG